MNVPIGIIRLSALALACAASLSAQANPSNADYAKVVLYGDVTIAQDSTASWGIWEQLEPPAAGVQAPLIALRASGDLYRPLGQLDPVPPVTPAIEGFCAGGSLCGFGVLANLPNKDDTDDARPVRNVAGPQAVREPRKPNQHAFQMFAADLNSEGNTNSWLPNAMSLSIKMLSVGEAALSDIERMDLMENQRTHQFFEKSAVGKRGIAITTLLSEIEGVDAGRFDGGMERRISGNSDPSAIAQALVGFWGVTTSTVNMAVLRASQATATYTGRGIDAVGNHAGNKVMNVNFGTSTFTMSVNGGSDINVSTQRTSAGTQLMGGVGYNVVEGTLTGSTFESRRITAVDGTIGAGSLVKGAFVGAGAAVAIGASDIVKTKVGTEGSLGYTNARHVNAFSLIKDGTVLNER